MFSCQPSPGITYRYLLPTACRYRYGWTPLRDCRRNTIPRWELCFISLCRHHRGSVLGTYCSPAFSFEVNDPLDIVAIIAFLVTSLVIAGLVSRVRKDAEDALIRKLLEGQEQERARIGRELHDDINQRLALLSVEIDGMKEVSPVTNGELRSRMDELGKRTSEISAVVQSLSHELHSSKLEYLGLVLAMKGFCKEFGEKHKVEVVFASEGVPPTMPPDISLCLFRVMQEGLHNALKHSGVKLCDVKLLGSPTEIRLTVRDLGKGFDPELAKDTPGLGLVSMQERVRLVKGTISITSTPLSGTEINVRVPLQAGVQTEQAKMAGA